MEKRRGTTVAVVAALIIAVVSLGIAFAAFSSTLNINGTATVQSSSWDIYFATAATGDNTKPSAQTDLSSEQIATSNRANMPVTASSTTANIVATTFTWAATFKTPGDQVKYTIYVKNGGSFAANVSNVTLPQLSCTGGANQAQADAVCAKIHYGLYEDASGTTPVSTSTATLGAGQTATYYLIAYLDPTGWEGQTDAGDNPVSLPSVNVVTSTIQATVSYQQATN